MNRLTVSVALATFNGERYLSEQLDSIARQSYQPDELVVGDDGSDDRTRELLHGFSGRVPYPVRIATNAPRLGPSANFAAILRRCRGNLVLLSDQDDIWARTRLQRSLEVLEQHPSAAYAFSNAALIDGAGRSLAGELWQSFSFDGRQQRLFSLGRGHEVLLRRNVVTGATMVIRREYLASALPIPNGWPHDGWFAFLLELQHGAVAVDERWIAYRVHAAQQTGVLRVSALELMRTLRSRDAAFYLAESHNFHALAQRLYELGRDYERVARGASDKAAFLARRAAGRESLTACLRGLTVDCLQHSYQRHGLGSKQALLDLLAAGYRASRRTFARRRLGSTRRAVQRIAGAARLGAASSRA